MRIWEYIQLGGSIMYVLLLLNVVGLAVIGTKVWTLLDQRRRTGTVGDTLAQLIKSKLAGKGPGLVEEVTKQEVSVYMTKQERGINTIKIIATISPLLGLLGTVMGILLAFQTMAESGMTNPATFAKGIYLALITTVGGLVVAIPHYVAHSYLLGLLDEIEVKLEGELVQKLN